MNIKEAIIEQALDEDLTESDIKILVNEAERENSDWELDADEIISEVKRCREIGEMTGEINFSPLTFADESKERIQREAYDKWAQAGYFGTLQIATGVGKTMIGLMAIQQEVPAEVIIVVPKIDLMLQWENEILEHFGQWNSIHTNIGKIGGGFTGYNKAIQICVVNSLREVKDLEADLLIMDEMHRYGSEENFKFLENGKFKKILGLTATATRQDGAHSKLFKHAPLIYNYTQKDAIEANILSKFDLINVRTELTPQEKAHYSSLNRLIGMNFSTFHNDFNLVRMSVRDGGVRGSIASDLMRAFTKRKSILSNAKSKVDKTIELITADENNSKTLVFCELIKTADQVVKELKARGIAAGKYHSGMKSNKKEEMLNDFRENKVRVMVTVKSLDEGTNIPDCEVAIIAAGSGVKRQMIQRLGRILRKTEDKGVAKVYQIYIPDTKEYDWLMKRQSELVKNANTVRWV